jgi:dephospho-CoA kinase
MSEMKHAASLIRILLGGGIGSGKSLTGRRFAQLGATVIDADRLGHAVLEPGGRAFETVSERWPSVVVADRIDRSALAEIVFTDLEQLTELEALTHPPIIHRMTAIASSAGDLVIEIPLILDIAGEWTKVFVDADEDFRLFRAVERGNSETDVKKRMASQPSRDEWMTWSDVTIDNNGSIEDLDRQIDAYWYRLRTAGYGVRR